MQQRAEDDDDDYANDNKKNSRIIWLDGVSVAWSRNNNRKNLGKVELNTNL